MATFEEYLVAPDPAHKVELVRGEIIYRRPGPVAHAEAIMTLVGVWIDDGARLAVPAHSPALRQAAQPGGGIAESG